MVFMNRRARSRHSFVLRAAKGLAMASSSSLCSYDAQKFTFGLTSGALFSPPVPSRFRLSNRHSLLRHLQCSLERLVATDETTSVNKDTAIHTAQLAQFLISHTSPRLGQSLAVLETAGLETDGTDPPLGILLSTLSEESIQNVAFSTALLLQSVQVVHPWDSLFLPRNDENSTLWVEGGAGVECLGDDGASRQPGCEAVCELEGELLADEGGGVQEAGVFDFGGFGSVEGAGCACVVYDVSMFR